MPDISSAVDTATAPRPRFGVRVPAWRPTASRRGAIVSIALSVLLGATAVMLQVSQADATRQLEDRFRLRMALGSGFVRSYLDDVVARSRLAAQTHLSGATIPEGALADVTPGLGFQVAVLLDGAGTLLQVVPHRDDIIGTPVAGQYRHLQTALAGQPAVSDVVRSAAEGLPVLAIATPFDTPYGRRVISGGVPASQTALATYLQASVPFTTSAAYLVDSADTVVASNNDASADLTTLPQPLIEAIGRTDSGVYDDGQSERFFTVEDVPNTPLRLVATVETGNLYAPVHGLARWLPWLVLSCLALVALYLIYVQRKLARSQARLQSATVELERSNRELQDFAAIASHDLQEPLRKIQSFGDRLATTSQESLDEDSRDYLARMLDAASRMQTLIQELLAYSRLTTRPEAPRAVDLNRTVREVVDDLSARIAATEGTVDVGPLPGIQASPFQMHQLFQNLIGNSLKFQRPGVAPYIQVAATTAAPGMHGVRVTDNGIGLDEQYAEKIFAPFQRLHGRTEYEGTGMGLAICRRIVERHGGTISVESSPGEGTSFFVELPASK